MQEEVGSRAGLKWSRSEMMVAWAGLMRGGGGGWGGGWRELGGFERNLRGQLGEGQRREVEGEGGALSPPHGRWGSCSGLFFFG